LIATLSKQLQGEIQLNRERGTEFKITFPSIFYKKRV
jgi:two-component sensor histidine kinase